MVENDASNNFHKATIYDLKLKYIAFTTSFPHQIKSVALEWGSIFLLLENGRIIKLDEKDSKSKLSILFKKNLYMLAINMLQNQDHSDDEIVEIYKKYGEHLYRHE